MKIQCISTHHIFLGLTRVISLCGRGERVKETDFEGIAIGTTHVHTERKISRPRELNPGPIPYQGIAIPLSQGGVQWEYLLLYLTIV